MYNNYFGSIFRIDIEIHHEKRLIAEKENERLENDLNKIVRDW